MERLLVFADFFLFLICDALTKEASCVLQLPWLHHYQK